MAEFIYFVEPTRIDFIKTATEAELAIVGEHADFLRRKLACGELILVGRTQDETPVGVCIFEATDAAGADAFMREDPAIGKGVFVGSVRPYHVFLMRGRDDVAAKV
jgi:uncharacterized protein YciI